MTTLTEMFDALRGARGEVLPSKFWEHYTEKTTLELMQHGYENFKRTVALSYFTSLPMIRGNWQLAYLVHHLPWTVTLKNVVRTLTTPRHRYFTGPGSRIYTLLTYMLWEYVRRIDHERLLERFAEPVEGNPPRISLHGRLISQDIANAVLEYKSIMEADFGRRPAENIADLAAGYRNGIRSVIELGAGHGRTAFVFLRLLPKVKYIIVDIPPALYISQRYLTSQFPERTVFAFRPFQRFEDVREEFERGDIAFLLPNQLELLPDKLVDLFVNISSLHEMGREQIAYYFGEIDRVTRGYVYLKQWQVSHNPHDNLVIRDDDYPIKPHWTPMYRRECRVHTRFFEAMFRVS